MVRQLSGTPPQKTIHEIWIPATVGTDLAVHATGGGAGWNAFGGLINAAAEYAGGCGKIPSTYGTSSMTEVVLVFACPATAAAMNVGYEFTWNRNGQTGGYGVSVASQALGATTQDNLLFFSLTGMVTSLNTGTPLLADDIVNMMVEYQLTNATNIIFLGCFLRWAAT